MEIRATGTTLKCPVPLVKGAVHSGRLRASETKYEFRLPLTVCHPVSAPSIFSASNPANDCSVNDKHRSCHVTKFLEIGQGAGILSYVSLLKGHAFLRKILLRLVAEHSPMLRVNHDVPRHSPPTAGVVPAANSRSIDSLAPLITSRTGLSE